MKNLYNRLQRMKTWFPRLGASVVALSLLFTSVALAAPVYFELENGEWQYSFSNKENSEWTTVKDFWWNNDINALIWTDVDGKKYKLGVLGNVIDMTTEERDIGADGNPDPVFDHPRYGDKYDVENNFLYQGEYNQRALSRTKNTWQGNRGYYYQLDSNGKLWMSTDGMNWKKSLDNVWQGLTGAWYKLEKNQLYISHTEGEDWIPSLDGKWKSLSGDTYKIHNGMLERTQKQAIIEYERPMIRRMPTTPNRIQMVSYDYPQYNNKNMNRSDFSRDWQKQPNNLWKNEEMDIYYQLRNDADLWHSYNGVQWERTVDGIWQGQTGLFYKISNRMELYNSMHGQDWSLDDDQMWMNNNVYYQIDKKGNVYFQR